MWRERLPDPRVGPSLPTYLHHATCISHWPLPPMRPTLSMYVLTRREREREYKWGRVTDREEMVGAEPSVRTQATSCGMTRVEGTASSVFSLTILAIRNLFRASTALFQQQRPARPPPPPRVTCMWRALFTVNNFSALVLRPFRQSRPLLGARSPRLPSDGREPTQECSRVALGERWTSACSRWSMRHRLQVQASTWSKAKPSPLCGSIGGPTTTSCRCGKTPRRYRASTVVASCPRHRQWHAGSLG